MTISSDGCLYFGFLVGDEEEAPEWLPKDEDDNSISFDDFVCQLAGVALDEPYKERKKVLDACPADLFMFCSYDCPMYILGIRGEELRANRGYTVKLEPKALEVSEAKIAAFKEWCEANKIPYEEPKWFLCSMYG